LPPGNRRSFASGAVDLLAQQVGVAQVAGVLLDHVQVDQAERHDLAVVGELIVQGRRRPRRRRRCHGTGAGLVSRLASQRGRRAAGTSRSITYSAPSTTEPGPGERVSFTAGHPG